MQRALSSFRVAVTIILSTFPAPLARLASRLTGNNRPRRHPARNERSERRERRRRRRRDRRRRVRSRVGQRNRWAGPTAAQSAPALSAIVPTPSPSPSPSPSPQPTVPPSNNAAPAELQQHLAGKQTTPVLKFESQRSGRRLHRLSPIDEPSPRPVSAAGQSAPCVMDRDPNSSMMHRGRHAAVAVSTCSCMCASNPDGVICDGRCSTPSSSHSSFSSLCSFSVNDTPASAASNRRHKTSGLTSFESLRRMPGVVNVSDEDDDEMG